MKRTKLTVRQLLALCYAAAAVVWVLRCVLGCGIMLNYKLRGEMPTAVLGPDDLVLESMIDCAADKWTDAPDDRPDWYLTSDNDPHIFWQGEGYIESVRLHAEQLSPPGGVALYYLLPGQTEYSEAQKVVGRLGADNELIFDFGDVGGVYVSGLRLDPDSVGGVYTRLLDVTLNPVTPWPLRFVPGAGALLLLLFAPPLAAAVSALLLRRD